MSKNTLVNLNTKPIKLDTCTQSLVTPPELKDNWSQEGKKLPFSTSITAEESKIHQFL